MTNISLNVNRQKLIDQLTEKRAEIAAAYEKRRATVQAQLDELVKDSGGWAEWHTAVAAGLEDGTLQYSDRGKLVAAQRGGDVPTRPNSTVRTASGTSTKADLEYLLSQIGEDGYYWRCDVAPLDSALRILELSDDDTVQIAGSDYDRLLSTQFRWNV